MDGHICFKDNNICCIPTIRTLLFIVLLLYICFGIIIVTMYDSIFLSHHQAKTIPHGHDNDSLFYGMGIDNIMERSLHGRPGQYLSQFHNPCWFSKTMSDGKELNCLPKAYIIGMIKSGTTDLKESLKTHPDILVPTRGWSKEIMWWNIFRFQVNATNTLRTLADYLNLMRKEIKIIERLEERHALHHKIILDPSSTHANWYRYWRDIPGNKGLKEPQYLMPHSLHALVPQAKIIVVMRNPTTRLLSHYRMSMHYHVEKSNPQYFHQSVVRALEQFRKCTHHRSLRACAYDPQITDSEIETCVYLTVGLYHVFLKDWLAVFPLNQFLFIRAEDYYKNRTVYLRQTIKFLDLRPISSKQVLANENRGVSLSGAWGSYHMWNETKDLLNDYYREHNALLAEILGSTKWLWSDSA